jgi:hypothetical protein
MDEKGGLTFVHLRQILWREAITFDYKSYVAAAFAHTGPRNPLKAFDEADKWRLVSLLAMFLVSPSPSDNAVEDFEKLAEIARHTKTWAKKIRLALNTQFSRELQSMPSLKTVLGSFHDLPLRVEAFGILFGGLLDRIVGKSGQKSKLVKNQFLIMASEFVRLKTKRYNDEHLAELIQALSGAADLSDISGDAIHKKREHMKRTYPLVYARLFNRVRDFGIRKTPLPLAEERRRKAGIR